MVDAYRRTAPRLLSNLAQILSQHKWSDGGRVPHGLVNILNYTWQELTAGARLLTQHTDKPCMSLGPLNQDLSPRPLSANQKREREVAPCQAKPQVSFNPSVKKRKSRSSKGRLQQTICCYPLATCIGLLNTQSRYKLIWPALYPEILASKNSIIFLPFFSFLMALYNL